MCFCLGLSWYCLTSMCHLKSILMHYIGLASFTIITDHYHTRLLALRQMSIDLLSWVNVHTDGQHHKNTDALSCRPKTLEMRVAENKVQRVLQVNVGSSNQTDITHSSDVKDSTGNMTAARLKILKACLLSVHYITFYLLSRLCKLPTLTLTLLWAGWHTPKDLPGEKYKGLLTVYEIRKLWTEFNFQNIFLSLMDCYAFWQVNL